jgi:hypothetical protein
MRIVSLKPAIGLAGTRSCDPSVYSRLGSESLEKKARRAVDLRGKADRFAIAPGHIVQPE